MSNPPHALAAADFRRFVELNAALELGSPDDSRCSARRTILDACDTFALGDSSAAVRGLPAAIGEAMKPFGWLWNGFYVPRGENELHLAAAFGPPVCSPLERSGGPLTSGMCFDALLLNQTLVAYDAKVWPGYVSCDSTSGLGTVSGIVCPVRDPAGAPVAVWDLDATQEIEPGDVRFMDVLFATLGRCVAFSRESF